MLAVDPETVCFIIVKARGFEAKVPVQEPDEGSNPSDEDMREVLEDYADDSLFEELTATIESLNEEEQINLVALAWLGRGDFDKDEWQEGLETAAAARSDHTASYLLGMPQLPDYLEEGLAAFGHTCDEVSKQHL